jgi:hypothetical protein
MRSVIILSDLCAEVAKKEQPQNLKISGIRCWGVGFKSTSPIYHVFLFLAASPIKALKETHARTLPSSKANEA